MPVAEAVIITGSSSWKGGAIFVVLVLEVRSTEPVSRSNFQLHTHHNIYKGHDKRLHSNSLLALYTYYEF